MVSETKKGSLTNDKKDNCKNTLLSAYIKYFGKEDDCYERLVLTQFRDYMMTTQEGKKLVKKYYKIAPKIVEAIEASDKKNICYLYIKGVIEKCVAYGEREFYGYVEIAYRFMVKNLKKEFNL